MGKKVIIDCDPGIDDALALLIAFASEELEVLGITAVAGNVSSDLTARNALALCALAGKNIEVAVGASGPLSGKPCNASDVHGSNGLGNVDLPLTGSVSSRSADEMLFEELIRHNGELELIAMGPLTNIALLIKNHPDVLLLVKKLTIMGGSLGRGNVTRYAEFNFYADPLAADIVLRSGIPIEMYGLDVTNHALLFAEQIDEIEGWGGLVLTQTVAMIRYYQAFYRSKGLDGLKMHDPLAVAGVIDPEITKRTPHALGVETRDPETLGRVLVLNDVEPEAPRNVDVCLEVDQDAFSRLFMGLMKSYR